MATQVPHFEAFIIDPIAIVTDSDGTAASKLTVARAQMDEYSNGPVEEA